MLLSFQNKQNTEYRNILQTCQYLKINVLMIPQILNHHRKPCESKFKKQNLD